jgi:hypothetical protein
MTRNME